MVLLAIQACQGRDEGELQRIERNPGILPVKEGSAMISNDKWIIIKTLDLSLVYEEIEFNINRYANLNKHVLNYYGKKALNYQLADVKIQADHLKTVTIEKYQQLVPTKRLRRGLLNPLGSLIKALTGNLDNEDAMKYDKLINNVKSHQTANSEKLSLITEMMGAVINNTNVTNRNFVQLDKEIWEIRKLLNLTVANQTNNELIHIYNLFLHNFQMLYIRLDEIETAVAFSKLKTLHQSILDSEELITILKGVERYERLPYTVDHKNLIKIEQCIEMKAYSKNNQIIFIIEVPLVEKHTYFYYRVLPLPITNNLNQTVLIIPKQPYLLVNKSKTLSLSKRCKELERNTFMCDEDIIIPKVMEDTCIADLMKFTLKVTTCHPIPVEMKNVKVEPIQHNRWILYSKASTLLETLCGNEITRTYIQGTYIATVGETCELKIGDVTLRHHRTNAGRITYPKLPVINFPEVSSLTAAEQQWKPINLDEIDLRDLQALSYVLKRRSSDITNKFDRSENAVNVRNVSLGTLLLYALLFLVLLYYIIQVFRRRDRNHQPEITPPDNFELREGGVMHSEPTPRLSFLQP